MKRYVLIVWAGMMGAMGFAQKPYSVYDWSGQVRLKEHNASQWLPAQKSQAVSGLDSVDIASNGVLRIIDTRSNLIYASVRSGQMRVLNLINDAKKQNSNTLAAVNRELLNGAKGGTNVPTMQVTGATTRGDDDELTTTIASTFGWLAMQACEGKLDANSSELKLNTYPVGDGVSFEMQNASSKGYYVNVLHVNKRTRIADLCYIIDQSEEPDAPYLYLPQGETMKLPGFVFVVGTDDAYILVGTEDEYIPQQVQSELKHLSIESAHAIYPNYVYFQH